MSSRFARYDSHGQEIRPGDVCIRATRSNNKLEYIVYKGTSWGGGKSKGEFGRFITNNGMVSIKFTSVLFSFDPMGERKPTESYINKLVRQFYEEK